MGSFVPFGYRKAPQDKNRLLVDDDAAEVVATIFGMYKDGFQIEVVLHLDRVLRFIETFPQKDRRVSGYEAQMTRLEEEIRRYKKLELGLYENFVEGIINKAEYTDFRENYHRFPVSG